MKGEEKERDNLFPQTREDDADLQALGPAMAARKAELMALAKGGWGQRSPPL